MREAGGRFACMPLLWGFLAVKVWSENRLYSGGSCGISLYATPPLRGAGGVSTPSALSRSKRHI